MGLATRHEKINEVPEEHNNNCIITNWEFEQLYSIPPSAVARRGVGKEAVRKHAFKISDNQNVSSDGEPQLECQLETHRSDLLKASSNKRAGLPVRHRDGQLDACSKAIT